MILGDTYDPSAIAPLCHSASLLVHESTDAYMPPHVDPEAKRTEEAISTRIAERGHSTPTMAGAFAKLIQARHLVMNHIGCRFPAPQFSHRQRNTRELREGVTKEMERQANEAWGLGKAQSAVDYLKVDVHALRGDPELEPEENGVEEAGASWRSPHAEHRADGHNNWGSHRGHRGMDNRDRGGGGIRGYMGDGSRGAGSTDYRGRGRGDGRGFMRDAGRGTGDTEHRGRGGGYYRRGYSRGAGGNVESDRTEPKRKRLDP